jgi:hypothetical protein
MIGVLIIGEAVSFAAGQWFSPGTLVSSTNKTDCHDITDILLRVALNTITPILLGFFYRYRVIHVLTAMLVVIGTDCIGSYKFNYHMIMDGPTK